MNEERSMSNIDWLTEASRNWPKENPAIREMLGSVKNWLIEAGRHLGKGDDNDTDEEAKQGNEDVSASAAQAHNATGADAPRSAGRDLPEQPDSAADESGDHKNQGRSSHNQLGPSL